MITLLDCSSTTRPLRAVFARLAVAALVVAAAGCQSNSERDLIARDRRLQEDQIFALQDYVNQYQKLVCRYRAENCQLRRQLGEGYSVQVQPSEPQPMPSNGNYRFNDTPRNTSPRFQPPPVKPKQPETNAPPLEEPAIPPLKSTSSNETDAGADIASDRSDGRSRENTTPQVVNASYEEPVADPERAPITPIGSTEAERPAPARTTTRRAPSVGNAGEVLLMGELVANEAGGGPRIAVDVVPFDASGRVGKIDGNVSLMLLAKDADGQSKNLGRWDFNPEDVRAAVDPAASEPAMRFFIELPAIREASASNSANVAVE